MTLSIRLSDINLRVVLYSQSLFRGLQLACQKGCLCNSFLYNLGEVFAGDATQITDAMNHSIYLAH